MVYSPDGRRIASGASDKTVRVWDCRTGQDLCYLRGHTNIVYSVAFFSDGRRVASGAEEGNFRIWDTDTGSCNQVIRGEEDVAAFAAADSVYGWLALSYTLETVIKSSTTRQQAAWLPAWLHQVKTHTVIKAHPDGRSWAGAGGDHLYVLTLEGSAEP